MGQSMTLNEQLNHSMKKLKLDNPSDASGNQSKISVHTIPDGTSPSSPFRKRLGYLSGHGSSPWNGQNKKSTNAAFVKEEFLDGNPGAFKCDSPILNGVRSPMKQDFNVDCSSAFSAFSNI